MALRDYQIQAKNDVYAAWQQGAFNVMLVLPTGAGKTTVFSSILAEFQQPACVVAHRQELTAQAALALNRERVPHGILAPKAVVRQIIALEHDTHGYSCYNYRAPVRVAGVDALRNHDTKDRWLNSVGLVVIDEGHHVVRNKWGTALGMFPNARGLFPTAHAIRADGQGLGRAADGFVDALVVGPSCRALINRGYLCDYRLVCVGSDIDFTHVAVGSTGDYSLPQLRKATHSSNRIVGDVVKHYLRFAAGKLGVTFAVDIEAAKELAHAYRTAGVSAEVITAKTPLHVRGQLMRQFRARQLMQLVSVDCLGEGVDVPAIEVVSMVRKTASWQLLCQQMGRALRVSVSDAASIGWDALTDAQRLERIAESAKPKAIVIDHVNNILWHAQSRGLPDSPQTYSLGRRESGSRRNGDAIPLRSCLECFQPYERFLPSCPYCGNEPAPQGRGSPEQVDGDLIELDPEVLAALRGEIRRVDGPMILGQDTPAHVRAGIMRNHHDRARAQQALRRTLMIWGGWQRHLGRGDREAQRRFFHGFGIDVLTAQTLGAREACELTVKIETELQTNNVVEAAQ